MLRGKTETMELSKPFANHINRGPLEASLEAVRKPHEHAGLDIVTRNYSSFGKVKLYRLSNGLLVARH